MIVRRVTSACALAAALVWAAAGPIGPAAAGQQQTPLFRSDIRMVPIYVTVTDRDNRLVPDLARDDFEVRDNGQPQEITFFLNEVQPFTAVVMLDTSISMTARLQELFVAAEQFLLRLLPEDRAVVGAFNDKIQIEGEFTGDRDALIASLKSLYYGNATLLYDAVDASLEQLAGIEGRRVIVVFTDGEDFGSRLSAGRVLDRARGEEVMIYGIGLETEFFNGQRWIRSRPDRILRRFAEETGGGFFDLKKGADLGPPFTRIAQELRSQYLLGFTPQVLDGRPHRLEVRVKQPGMTARARRSYVASAETMTQSP